MSGTLRIYLGNVPPGTTPDDVRALFAAHGEVTEVELITDRQTGAPRGFGFVTMGAAEAERAIADLDGLDWRGSLLRVNESHDRGASPPRRSW